jgi:predicted SAM-dependent methyltransferase
MNLLKKIFSKIRKYSNRQLLLLKPCKKIINSIQYHIFTSIFFRTKYHGLHLGSGGIYINDFINLDADPYSNCDIVCNVEKLKINSNCVQVLYNSHIFEHINQKNAKLVLQEWFRVLEPGGKLYISVPDCEVLYKIYLDNLPDYDNNKKNIVDLTNSIIYGGQSNRFDYHYNGFSFQTLRFLLFSVGFSNVDRFNRSELSFANNFSDASSSAKIDGIPISLNVVAQK